VIAVPVVQLRVEKSKSRTGKHAVRDIALLVYQDGRVEEVKVKSKYPVKPVYSRGEAYLVHVEAKPGVYPVQVHLVRNLWGHVKGYIEVYGPDGVAIYRAVYRKLKLRYSRGDDRFAWIVELVAKHLNLPVKRVNLKKPQSRGSRAGR
jgi:hypothetical protein